MPHATSAAEPLSPQSMMEAAQVVARLFWDCCKGVRHVTPARCVVAKWCVASDCCLLRYT